MNNKQPASIAFLIFTSIIVSFVTFFCCLSKQGYELLFLFPATFAATIVLFKPFLTLVKKYTGFKILFAIYCLKYLVLPFSISFSDINKGIGIDPTPSNIRIATLILLMELFVVVAVLSLAGKKFLLAKKRTELFKKGEKYNGSNIGYILVIALAIVLLILHPDLINNFSFINYNSSSKTISYFLGLDIRIVQLSFSLIFIVSTSICAYRYSITRSGFYYYFSLFIGLLTMVVIKGDNRASFLVSILSTLITMIVAFPSNKKKTFISIIIVGGLALVSLSIYRQVTVTDWRPQGGQLSFTFDSISGTLQTYLSGPRLVAQGLGAIQHQSISFSTIFSDIFIWSGYIGNILSDRFGLVLSGTSYAFNAYLYGESLSGVGDQIVPLSVQSIWYFGFFGALVLPVLISLLLVYFESKFCSSKTYGQLFINAMMVIIFGLFPGYNISILFLYYFDRYLISYLIILVIDEIKKRTSKRSLNKNENIICHSRTH